MGLGDKSNDSYCLLVGEQGFYWMTEIHIPDTDVFVKTACWKEGVVGCEVER
jgi:hypothetical protein